MLGFLAKGLLRDRSRSLFPFLTVAVGVTLSVVMDAYMRGAKDSILQTTAGFVSGHLRLTTRAAAAEGIGAANELALLEVTALMSELRREWPEVTWTPRIRFGGLIDVPDASGNTRVQAPAAGIAVDLGSESPEWTILKLKRSLARGALPAAPGEVLLADDFARRLGVEPGDRLTLVSSTMNGSLAVVNLTLSGTVRFGVSALDRGALLADIGTIQRGLDMDDAADEILGFFSTGYDDRAATALAARFNAAHAGGDEFAPEMNTLRTASGLGSTIDLLGVASALVVGVFVLAMAVVLWNAGLMGSLRRYGEIGIRLALGESKPAVYGTLLAEAFLIGLAGSATGTAVGLAFSYWLQEVGINIGGMMRNASIVMDDVLRARIAPTSYIIGFLPGLLATFFGAAISGLGVYRRQTATLAKELSG